MLTNQNWFHEAVKEQIKSWECLQPSSSEYFIFSPATAKCRAQSIQNYNFACSFV
jgi:hypothetical protein